MPTPDLIEYEGGDVLANLEERTITGCLIPFNELGNTNAGRFMVTAETFPELPADPSIVGLNLDHERSQPVGRGVRIWQDDNVGIMATLRVAETPEGDAALADALDPNGTRRRFSGEFHVAIKAGKAVARSGRLWGAALVKMGAFPSAQVLAADTSSQYMSEYTDADGVTWRRVETSETTTTETDSGHESVTTTTVTESTTTPEGEPTMTEPTTVTATAVPGTLTPPAAPAGTTNQREVSISQVLASVVALRTNPGDDGARAVLAAMADIPMTGAGALPGASVLRENWLGKLYQGIPYVRQYIQLGNLGTDITAAGKAGFQVFRGLNGAASNVPGNGAWAGFPNQVNGYQGSTNVLRSQLSRFVLAQAIDRAYNDLPGGEEALAAYLALVIEDHLIWSDRIAREDLISQAVPVVAATAKYPANYPAALGQLIQGILSVKKRKADQRNDVPTFAIANDAAFEQLAYAAGGEQNLPAFVKIALSTDRTATVDGDVVIVNGDTGITGTPSVVIGAQAAVDFDELPNGPLVIDALELARGGLDKATHGYLQRYVKRPEAFAHIGTPDAWAQGSYGRGILAKVGAGILRGAPTDPLAATAATAGAAPALPGAVGGTVVDGAITWTRIA